MKTFSTTRLSSMRTVAYLSAMILSSVVFLILCQSGAAQVYEENGAVPHFAKGRVSDYFTDIQYDPSVPTPERILGYPLGAKPARYDEVIGYLRALAESSPRAELVTIGATHEGRRLYYLLVGSAAHVAKRDDIRAGLNQLANPGVTGSAASIEPIVARSPVVAWIGHSIHGDELSGTDASLWTAYHMVAAQDDRTQAIRDSVLVIIDPSENPDGRERYLAQVYAFNGYVPSSDAQSLHHRGVWPWGRTNHYLFDLNRDWLPLVHPETRARVAVINEWNPQVVVDAHEMGSYSSFLMSPPREPVNFNATPTLRRWREVFAADQGREFDRRGWSYYTGDWHEEWYPGYGSSWSMFTGAVGILYEQARVHGSSVKRPDGVVLDYAETVAHQTVSSLASLSTAAHNRRVLLDDYVRFHQAGSSGLHAGLEGAFILTPTGNFGREAEFIETILRQGLEVKRSQSTFSATIETPGGTEGKRTFPAGSFLVPLAQPRGLLAKAILEFDPHLSPQFLQEERRELEKGNGTRLYEVSSWSLALAYDLDVVYAKRLPSVNSAAVEQAPEAPPGMVREPGALFGFLLPVRDDRSMVALTRMLESGLTVRATTKPFTHGSVGYESGTLLLRRSENPDDFVDRLTEIAQQTGVVFQGTSSNYSSSGPDLGSDYFELLYEPRVGLMAGSRADYTSFGQLWYLFDDRLRMRHSILDAESVAGLNLSIYNIIIIPSYWGGPSQLESALGAGGVRNLKDWVKDGGTLIAIGSSAYFCADSSNGLSAAREYSAVLSSLDDFEKAYQKERAAFVATVDTTRVWSGSTISQPPKLPPAVSPKFDDLKEQDDWSRRFHPDGVIAKLELNPEHWLTFGTGGRASAMLIARNALMARYPVAAAARIAPAATMRLSGLLWPEARQRWAKTAFVTRESHGRGQIILFADDPFFRGYFHGTKRLLLNAVLLGPGMGTRQPAPW